MNTAPEQHTTLLVPKKHRKQQYDKKHNTNTTLKIGDKVLKEAKTLKGGKLDKRCTDPFIISEGLGKRRFQLKTSEVKTLKQTIHYMLA